MYYTYLWLREDSTPYYVGKGKGRRAFMSQGHAVNCPKQKDRIVIYPADSETDAFEIEVALIWYYGRKDIDTGILHNRTDGGDCGPIMAKELNPMHGKRRPDLAERNRQRIMPEKERQALRERNKSARARAAVSVYAKTRVGDKNPNFGNHLPADSRRKISEARKGKRNSPATEFKKKEKPQMMTEEALCSSPK